MAKDSEFTLHIWKKPGTRHMTALYTVTIGPHPLCIDLPIDAALEHMREQMEEAE